MYGLHMEFVCVSGLERPGLPGLLKLMPLEKCHPKLAAFCMRTTCGTSIRLNCMRSAMTASCPVSSHVRAVSLNFSPSFRFFSNSSSSSDAHSSLLPSSLSTCLAHPLPPWSCGGSAAPFARAFAFALAIQTARCFLGNNTTLTRMFTPL